MNAHELKPTVAVQQLTGRYIRGPLLKHVCSAAAAAAVGLVLWLRSSSSCCSLLLPGSANQNHLSTPWCSISSSLTSSMQLLHDIMKLWSVMPSCAVCRRLPLIDMHTAVLRPAGGKGLPQVLACVARDVNWALQCACACCVLMRPVQAYIAYTSSTIAARNSTGSCRDQSCVDCAAGCVATALALHSADGAVAVAVHN
jgi:hypothetical protein